MQLYAWYETELYEAQWTAEERNHDDTSATVVLTYQLQPHHNVWSNIIQHHLRLSDDYILWSDVYDAKSSGSIDIRHDPH